MKNLMLAVSVLALTGLSHGAFAQCCAPQNMVLAANDRAAPPAAEQAAAPADAQAAPSEEASMQAPQTAEPAAGDQTMDNAAPAKASEGFNQ